MELKVCLHCGSTWDEIRSEGLVGCPACYDTFGEELRLQLYRLQGAWLPPGAAPAEGAGAPDRAERMAQLREQLSDALRREDYALAQVLKERIAALESRGRA